MTGGHRRAVLIAGPTASGKSALALDIARREGGIIVNTDAMQVYDTLRVVTARPGVEAEQSAPHRLYGVVPVAVRYSTGRWLAAVQEVMGQSEGPLIFVGGTGLYFDALINGFAEIPAVGEAAVLAAQQRIEGLDAQQRLALLMAEDPDTARRLKVVDPQRLTRALAVKLATGRTLSSFQSEQPAGALLAGWTVERIMLDPDRQILRERIARRFETMFESGAVAEVEAVRAAGLDPSLPAMKAIGVGEIGGWLEGRLGREEAIGRAVIATQQYAKRQRTWFGNRFGDWPRRPA